MEAVVIYESMFGNTAEIARAVAEGLSEQVAVRTVEVSATAPADDVLGADLIVVGGPTHAFGMSRLASREEAAGRRPGSPTVERGIREWLDALADDASGRFGATFDTRVKSVKHLPGSAARAADRVVRRRGLSPADSPHSFYVEGMEGPLCPGEVERAREWGRELGRTALLARQSLS
ncbi:flavodoxin family protein [Oerskovia rustica]|uniref:Flavodoxin family protein n=1 Tax=Oerskovia rustica TaxID=2762237 RepID=A0ABR8RQU8_9CELL|nr:flavodoxin domain-containing protein [Oerskovia rustica]MBD7950145.1 flavodoxin family protein [Oerskovia rustica]